MLGTSMPVVRRSTVTAILGRASLRNERIRLPGRSCQRVQIKQIAQAAAHAEFKLTIATFGELDNVHMEPSRSRSFLD
jgi:hypothetical protein